MSGYVEREVENLREQRGDALEQVRILTEKVRRKEDAEVKLKEMYETRIQNQEDQVRNEHREREKIEAEKLKREWEDWCRSKKVSLDKNGIIVERERYFSELQMIWACEIIRRSDTTNPLLRQYIWTVKIGLEYENYPIPPTKDEKALVVHGLIKKKASISVCIQSNFQLTRLTLALVR